MSTPHWKTIDAWLAGTADAAERASIEAWLAADPTRRDSLEALRGRSAVGHMYDVDAAWLKMKEEVIRRPATSPVAAPALPIRRHVVRIAATIVVAAGALAIWQAARSPHAAFPSAALATVTTGPGERRDITLADGSRVTLNAVSSLTYDTSAAGVRDVTLDGEAYFDIRHDAKRPFRVHANDNVAEDIGTRFVVRAYRELPQTEVAVAEGAVRLARAAGDTASRLLSAGDVGTMRTQGPPLVSRGAEGEAYFGFMHGVLALDGQTLGEALPRFERRYGVTVTLSDSTLAKRRVHARFETESVDQAIEAIALALDASHRRTGRSIVLSPRGR